MVVLLASIVELSFMYDYLEMYLGARLDWRFLVYLEVILLMVHALIITIIVLSYRSMKDRIIRRRKKVVNK